MTIICPWPPRALSPNARVHWGRKATAAKRYRRACYFEALAAGYNLTYGADLLAAAMGGRYLRFCLIFYPPDGHLRDDDNLAASFKAGRDGIAQALGIDDNLFRSHIITAPFDKVRASAVHVTIRVQADDQHG